MAQDVGQEGYVPEDTEERDPQKPSRVWPWVALGTVVLVVILLLWLYWRQPQQASMQTLNKKSVVPVAVPQPTEPIIAAQALSSTETPAARLVPDVMGDPKNSAVRALEGAGYVVSISEVYSTSKASGVVIGQNPGGGASLDQGETVSIVVSVSTRATKDVKMPQIVGLSQASAESKVTAAGLVPYITYGNAGAEDGHVISQWPLAGEVLAAGSEGFIQVQLNP